MAQTHEVTELKCETKIKTNATQQRWKIGQQIFRLSYVALVMSWL